jgi:hypothetical protein
MSQSEPSAPVGEGSKAGGGGIASDAGSDWDRSAAPVASSCAPLVPRSDDGVAGGLADDEEGDGGHGGGVAYSV